MSSSVRIGTIRGIELKLHFSWFIALIVFSYLFARGQYPSLYDDWSEATYWIVGIASLLFAVALLASGLNSTVTATLAGQIVMEGFLRLRLPHWARRLITRGVAIVPVVIVTGLYGERGTTDLLVLSQVILSMQLPFAVIPLVTFVSDRTKMGRFAIPRGVSIVAWAVAALIVGLNLKLLFDTFSGWL